MLDLHLIISFIEKIIIPAAAVLVVGLASVLFFQSASVFLSENINVNASR